MEPGADITAIILGTVGLGISFLGWIFTRRGKREEIELTAAKHHLDALTLRVQTAEAGEARQRERAVQAEEELDEVRDTSRRRAAEREAEYRAEIAAQTATCRAEVNRLSDALQLMHTVVRNEVAKVAAEQALTATSEHRHPDEVDEWLNAPPDLD